MSSNWRLDAISNAAKNRKKTSFVLKAGENKVGKKKDCLLRIPSLLCSREHCTIYLKDDKVTIQDKSRNGIYITFSGSIGTKHYLNATTERELEADDIISFGFNTASVYAINDKNAFIYRLVKEVIEVINFDDSDDETSEAPARIIQIENRVIDIPSESDSEYSGSEYFQNIEEIDHQKSSNDEHSGSDYSGEDADSCVESGESNESDEDAGFVVTKTIHNCAEPTETITLDEDSSASEREAEARPCDVVEESAQEKEEEKETKSNGMEVEESSTSGTVEAETPTTENDVAVPSGSGTKRSTEDSRNAVLEKVKKKLAESQPKKATLIKAQPLRKRRQTLTEVEYNQKKQDYKMQQERRNRLALLGEMEKKNREAAAEVTENNRVPFVPKVKIASVTRGDILCTDMLAFDTKNT